MTLIEFWSKGRGQELTVVLLFNMLIAKFKLLVPSLFRGRWFALLTKGTGYKGTGGCSVNTNVGACFYDQTFLSTR